MIQTATSLYDVIKKNFMALSSQMDAWHYSETLQES